MPMKPHLIEYHEKRKKEAIGKKYGKLTILEEDGRKNKLIAYKCLCECGNIRRNVNGYELKRGVINSCGCSYPKGHCRPCKTNEEYYDHVKKELLSKRNITGNCWEFTGQLDRNGYGRRTFTINGKKAKRPVHQTAYRLWKGEIPEKYHVCHSCDNPKCFNPDHLWIGTAKDNLQDMIKKGRASRLKGENAGRAKLKEKDVLDIRRMYIEGKRLSDMAKIYNVTSTSILYICNRKNWKHI